MLIVSSLLGNIVRAAIWINVECNIGIVCANLPLLRPVILATFPPSLRSAISRSTGSFGLFSSRRKQRSPSYKLSDEEDKYASFGDGSGAKGSKIARETVRHTLEHTDSDGAQSKKGKKHTNWFSVRGTVDDDDEDGEEMVPVSRTQ